MAFTGGRPTSDRYAWSLNSTLTSGRFVCTYIHEKDGEQTFTEADMDEAQQKELDEMLYGKRPTTAH